MKKFNYKILYLIRFLPFVFILLCALILYAFIYSQTIEHFQEDNLFIKKTYIDEEKKRIKTTVQRVEKYLVNLEKQSHELLKENLKEHVLTAYKLIENIYEQNHLSKSNEEITQLIKTALQNVRFNEGRGYYFIYDMNAKNIFHPIKPEMENKIFIDKKDAQGRAFQKERIALLRQQDEVFFKYAFNKPFDQTKEYEKLSFLKRFKPMNWFIGTGEYLDEFKKMLQEEALDFIRKLEYKDGGYIFVIKDKKVIANKYKELEGNDISTRPHLKHLFEQYKKVQKTDVGLFSQYELKTNDKEHNIKNKYSYVKHFKDWNWVLGTGFDLDNLENIIAQKQADSEKEFTQHLNKVILISSFIVLILLCISYVLSKYIENILLKYQRKLEKKNAALIKAQDVAKMANWEINVDTNELKCSETTYNILGISVNTKGMGEMFLKKILSQDDWKDFDRSIHKARYENNKIDCLFKIEQKDGSYLWVDCKGEYDEKNKKIFGTLQDITQLKKVEEEKLEKEKMLYHQNKMASMGEMLANIAHQWKQPLSSISTVSTGLKLQKEYGTLSDEQFMQGMDDIYESTKYLSTTIDDFKDFFKPQEEKVKLIYIQDVIDKAIKLVEARFKSSGIEIIKNIEALQLESMPNELIQVILNILNNSRDAFEDIKEKEKDKFVFINAYEQKGRMILEIFDNAKGIKEEFLGNIFDPYFTTKNEQGGTGIGLYMSNKIVTELLNSQIEVENYMYTYDKQECKGAKFTIRLPLRV